MSNKFFCDDIKKKLGFGFMRLPMIGEEVDHEETIKMVDAFMENGFNYFDTAHGYIAGKSEVAIRECLVKRYPREDFILVNKLTGDYFNSEEEIRPFFQSQLEACGVDYFDFYLMHAQHTEIFKKFKACRAYETAFALKAEGKVRHVGLSFHDKAEVLDQILMEYPEVEVVQIQLNYVDYEDESVEGRKCYEVCVKHNKPVLIMEPVKGGNLVNLPPMADKVFEDLNNGSNASYAIRYAAGFDQVMMVLSGMSNLQQMEDNISFMKDFKPLSEAEKEAVDKVCKIYKAQDVIPCTACRYCVEGCPKSIKIPDLFMHMNTKNVFGETMESYEDVVGCNGKASDCIKCGKCENACPQHLPIRDLLDKVTKEFE